MAERKTDEFTREEKELAELARTLSHPARIRILKLLTETQSCMCGELVEQLPLSQSTVSQHLKELKNAGLIQGEVEGPRICYCIDGKTLQNAKVMFEKLFTKLKGCC